MEDEELVPVATPSQFKALGHPMRHRLLFALGQGEATISQLAVTLGSNKGNVAHHLKVLADTGLVRLAGTRQVRGGTEQYYAAGIRDARLRGRRRLARDSVPTDRIGRGEAGVASERPDDLERLRQATEVAATHPFARHHAIEVEQFHTG